LKFISHRGNLSGKILERENTPAYIDEAIAECSFVEVDLRYSKSRLFLGHDNAENEVDQNWLFERKQNLYIHAKDLKTIQYLHSLNAGLNFFFHAEDDCTITSRGEIWVHPRAHPIANTIFVMPEYFGFEISDMLQCAGVCTDDVLYYRKSYNDSRKSP